MLERLLDRAAVAHPVVDDARSAALTRYERPLRARHAGLGRVDRDGRAQRARERLERRLDHVVRVRAGLDAAGAASAWRVGATARKNSSASSWSKSPIAPGRQRRPRTREQRPAGDVDRAASRAPRPSARSRGRSGRCRRGRRAPGRAPGRGRCPVSSTVWCAPVSRSPVTATSRSRRPWRASRSSMWSRKPTPGARARPRRCRRARARARTSVSLVLRSISAVRVIGVAFSRMRASIDSAWTHEALGAGDRRAPAAASRRRRVADAHLADMRRRKCRRRQRARRSARRRRWAGRGWSRRRSRRTRCPPRGPTNRQPGAGDRGRERLGVGADELQVLGRERLREARAPRRASAACDEHGRGATPSAARRERLELRGRARRSTSASVATAATSELPGPCSAWASRSSAHGSRRSAPSPASDDEQLARPREAVDPDVARAPGAWPPARRGCRGRRSRRRGRRSRCRRRARRSPGRRPSR